MNTNHTPTPQTPTHLKIVVSFNGKFSRRRPQDELRYAGGETKLISVDTTGLNYSNFRSLISERAPLEGGFKLKYQLPGYASEFGGDTPLVLLASDEDVCYMVEEFEAFYHHSKTDHHKNNNGSFRIWLYVCHDDADERGNEESLESLDGKRGDFGCGLRVLKRNLLDSFKGNHGFKKLSSDHNVKNSTLSNNVVGRKSHGKKSGGSEQDSLRKSVLKQQLLSRQREQIQGIVGLGHNQPLIEGWEVPVRANQVVPHQDSGRLPVSPTAGNVLEVKNGELGSSVGCFGQETITGGVLSKQDQLSSGSNMASQCLIKENLTVLQSSEVHNGVISQGFFGGQVVGSCGHMVPEVSGQCGLCNYQRFNCSCCPGSPCTMMVGFTGQPALSVANCCPGPVTGSKVLQEGQGMTSQFPTSVPNMVGSERQGEVLAVNSEWNPCLAPHSSLEEPPLIDLGPDAGVVEYEDYCQNRGINANVKEIYEVSGDVDQSSFGAPTHAAAFNGMRINKEEVGEAIQRCDTGFNPAYVSAISLDMYSYNPSQSSSKMATPAVSGLNVDVSERLQMVQQKLIDSTVEAKLAGVTEASNRPSVGSVNGVAAKWEGSCTSQQGLQDDAPTGTDEDEKVKIRQSLKYSKMLEGAPSDLAAFYTHLATRELQTIKESDLEYGKELGSGNYGTVYHGKWRGSDVAIKKLRQECFKGDTNEDDRLVADFWKEANMLATLHHPNIVAFYGVVTDGPVTNLATVTEYMINGSLTQVLQRNYRSIDRRKRLIIAMDAAFGMEYLHEKNIVHFDLKSHNFLVNMRDPLRPVCKIGDLGLSKIKQRTMVSGGVRGTIPWMAPELFTTSTTNLVTEKVDVYSFGIVMWELLTGEEPYESMSAKDIIGGIMKGTLRPAIPAWCDPLWRTLMTKCWSTDPDFRPSFSYIAKELRSMASDLNIK